MLVEGRLIVELKACRALADEHTAQILGYLKASRIESGLLINFGSYKFQIKKYVMSRERTQGTQQGDTTFRSFILAFFAFLCGHFQP